MTTRELPGLVKDKKAHRALEAVFFGIIRRSRGEWLFHANVTTLFLRILH